MNRQPGDDVQKFIDAFFRHFDEGLAQEPEFVQQLAYTSSRPRFASLLRLIQREPYDSLLEVGISHFIAVMRRLLPAHRLAALGLHLPEHLWHETDNIRLVQADLLAMPALDDLEPFDVVVCSEVIEHVQGNPITAFSGLRPLLRPNGRLIVSTPNVARLFNRIKLAIGRTPMEAINTVPWFGHFREYTRAEICEFLRRAGFVVEHAGYDPYWDTVDIYLSGGDRGFDAEGKGYYHPRFKGYRRTLAWPLLKALETLVGQIPSLQNGMTFVARPAR